MPKNGRPPPPPKPEELIEILDKKFEGFKVEMLESLESKSKEIQDLQSSGAELQSSTDLNLNQIRDLLQSLRQENDGKMNEMRENQEQQSRDMKKEFEMILLENVEDLKQDLGIIFSG